MCNAIHTTLRLVLPSAVKLYVLVHFNKISVQLNVIYVKKNLSIMANDICRLCLAKESDMIWIFDERISRPENMKEVIAITTGVEVQLSFIINLYD